MPLFYGEGCPIPEPASAPMGATLADVLHIDSRFIPEADSFGWSTIQRLWWSCERPYAPKVLKKFLNESIYACMLKKIRYPKVVLRRLKDLQRFLEGRGPWPPDDERRSAAGFETVRDIVMRREAVRRNLGHTPFSDYMAGVGGELEVGDGPRGNLSLEDELARLRERDRRKAAARGH